MGHRRQKAFILVIISNTASWLAVAILTTRARKSLVHPATYPLLAVRARRMNSIEPALPGDN